MIDPLIKDQLNIELEKVVRDINGPLLIEIEKLEKLVQKAIEGGWNLRTDELKLWDSSTWLPKDRAFNIADAAIHTHCLKEVIFNHDFAVEDPIDYMYELVFK